MADVRFDNVTKVYDGGVQAVDRFSMDIADGEFIVLVGPSGCGKSTTLRMLAGLETISDGSIRIDDRIVNDVPARDRDIAMVFQDYALYPHMTVRANLAFGIDRRRAHRSRLRALCSPGYAKRRRAELDEVRERVQTAAKTLGIESLLERHPRELSGGQRQRVALGRALVREPKVFLLDEPLSNLDAKLRLQMRAELRMLHRSMHATMVYVTHDQEEAMSLGDRLVVMHDGVLQQCDTPMEIYDRPANRFVAGFIGTPSMNFLPGRGTDTTFTVNDGPTLSLPSAAPDRDCVLGLRPDAIVPAPSGFTAVVEVVEQYGDCTDLVLRCGDHELVSRVRGHYDGGEGNEATFAVEDRGIHFFEADDDGRRID